MDKEYIVTLHRKEDLEKFYNEMKLTNFPLVKKRPLSRNTHYMMTEEQAERLRQDPRVWGVEEVDKIIFVTQQNNNEPYNLTGNFWKDDTIPPANVSSFDYQWGHVHCAGDAIQRGKNQFGSGSTFEQLNTSIDVFNDGRNVDVVIVDDSISYDNEEWLSPSTGLTRFVQYQWFNELNGLVSSIDDDGQSLPTGTITYDTSANIPQYHGNHVTGTACGQHYGWAREANIYNIAVTSTWPSGQSLGGLLIFDYLRAFHQTKPINPETGRRNPTITNHSYGSIINMPQKGVDENEQPIYRLDFADVTLVRFRGVIYDSNNPNPSGWTEAGLEADCGVRFGLPNYPGYSAAISADIQDAIAEGIVVIGAAGNDNLLMAEVGDQDYDNVLGVNGVGNFYYNRGGAPNTPDSGAINVGSLSKQADFRRSTFTQFGPSVDIFAPGDNILSTFNSTGLADQKYSAGNFFYPINGTSMASPQVCGVIACLASNKVRFTQEDARGLLNQFCIRDDMTFDLSGGGLDDNTCRFGSPNRYLHIENPRQSVGYLQDTRGDRTTGMTFPRFSTYYETGAPSTGPSGNTYTFSVGNSGASDYTFTGSDSLNTFNNSADPTIRCNAGDTLVFQFSISGSHPFWIKTVGTTGTGNAVLGSNAPVWEGIGLEGWTGTHNAPIMFTQALDDNTGGGNQVTWLQDYVQAVQSDPNNATADLETVANGGHNAFTTDATLQALIRSFFGGNNIPAGSVSGTTHTITPAQGYTYTIDGTSYPIMGSLWVPTGLLTTNIDAIVVFHGTVSGGTTLAQASEYMLDVFTDINTTNLNLKDKIVFAAAYPQDHIPQSQQYNLTGVGTEQADFLMGDNLPYARAAVEWIKNDFNSILSLNGTKEVADVYLFGHSQGGKLVSKINTIDTGIAGVVANSPGPIQFDQTCSADPGNTSCSKVIAIHDVPGSRADQGIMINNGQQTLDLTWDTTGVTAGTYYYICQYHIGMLGEIVIS